MAGDNWRVAVQPEGLRKPGGPFSTVMRVKASELVFIAGMTSGRDEAGEIIGKDDVAVQLKETYRKIGLALESVGATFENVVQFTVFLVKGVKPADFSKARMEIFPSLYPKGDYPPSTLLVIEALAGEGPLLEIEAIAALP